MLLMMKSCISSVRMQLSAPAFFAVAAAIALFPLTVPYGTFSLHANLILNIHARSCIEHFIIFNKNLFVFY
jgi:hypothetical protein